MHRMVKEAASYEKEAKAQEAKIQSMRDAGKDSYDIKKQEEVLQESYMMIPDSKARLNGALEDLQAFLVSPTNASWSSKCHVQDEQANPRHSLRRMCTRMCIDYNS